MNGKQIAVAIAKIIIDFDLDRLAVGNTFDFKILVQKIGYILHRLGCGGNLRFWWHSLGPYSRTLQNYYNTIAEIIRVSKSRYVDLGVELSDEYKKCVDKAIVILKEFRHTVGKLDVESLEVLASLAMLCNDIYPKPENPVEDFLKRKRYLARDFVEKVWRFLVDKNICIV